MTFRNTSVLRGRQTVILTSEKVALAGAIAETLGARQGQRTDLATSGNISGSEKGETGDTDRGGNTSTSDHGKTRDIAAAKAGLGSGKALEAAQVVIAKGVPDLVQAMDDGKVTIHAAKDIATLTHDRELTARAISRRRWKARLNRGGVPAFWVGPRHARNLNKPYHRPTGKRG